ncbi:MAG: UvrB/UvrC motif-containing protein, partial [Clostridia bacterium]|nr:UvrB/UvrC motif-containing protein [Clostridia bacterium]
EETNRRREVQMRYNLEHGITPKTVEKRVAELIKIGATDGGAKKRGRGKAPVPTSADAVVRDHAYADVEAEIERLTAEMKQAAAELRFEEAAYLRDKIKTLRITGK